MFLLFRRLMQVRPHHHNLPRGLPGRRVLNDLLVPLRPQKPERLCHWMNPRLKMTRVPQQAVAHSQLH